jgi:hypothetical protein
MGIEAGTLIAYAAVASAAVGVASAAGAFGKPGAPKGAPKMEMPKPEDTGKVSEEEAKDVARKRLFRAGIFATSPTGLGGGSEPTATARLR